ncbi:hypothetical protein K461DRAFT_294099 [Myriangium duriaei CBS 260.36]|uniref:Tubulin-specific chaperone D C-terminal domain-containing protein n=1 Tax=Myriangium duriaei CBS 260.36 TaxID=1168546 RepID=A0A9P4J4W5_9PEZI|nr:hypothetical protein K461DRAFT_294099 [Myriangium duriaei CBS 260.36]
MDSDDKDDLLLVKASTTLLYDLEVALPKITWKQKPDQPRKVHRYVRWRNLEHIIALIEPFQSEPQLLDAKLRNFIPSLVDAYLEFLQSGVTPPHREGNVCFDEAVSKLLYTFCKVRGEKVIAGFLNNEPRYFDLILSSLEKESNNERVSGDQWHILYILVLWLWHLSLAPFDLSTVSADPTAQSSVDLGFSLPATCPVVVARLLTLATSSLASLTREHQAAAKLLVRLVNRPDIQRLRLPQAIVPHACRVVEDGFRTRQVSQTAVGYLRFLVGMTSTGRGVLNAEFFPGIWATSSTLYDRLFTETSDSSAVNRKILIKMLRSIALTCLSSGNEQIASFAEQQGVLEDIIDKLLQTLSDRDTQVRFAAAKAMGAIISRLDKELASEVINAIVESFDMASTEDSLDFSFQDPQKWHGLTLSLAHCLFGRSVSAEQLPSVIKTLLPALNFEKRAVTGNSLGTNVRDAACFAIWSMSRRYTTTELMAVDASSFRLGNTAFHGLNLIQFMAVQLMVAACLDPAGNVRRGCSAALQEMIGRHPDQVHNGISLIQIIDYQAVGLRRRAMIDLVARASLLDDVYWMAFLNELQGWRGIGSPDIPSRQAAAVSVGHLCNMKPGPHVKSTQESLYSLIERTGEHATESHHGALLTTCEIADQKMINLTGTDEGSLQQMLDHLLHSAQHIARLEFTIRAVRADLPSATARYIITIFKLLAVNAQANQDRDYLFSDAGLLNRIIERLLTRSDEPVLNLIPELVGAIISSGVGGKITASILNAKAYLHTLASDAKRPVLHGACRALALATILPSASLFGLTPKEILEGLSDLVDASTIEWRVIGLRALCLILSDPSILQEDAEFDAAILPDIVDTVSKGLTDYSITERGDVGSLARLKALVCVEQISRRGLLLHSSTKARKLRGIVLKLALEKLDRVRLRAWQVSLVGYQDTTTPITPATIDDVSSQEYFYDILKVLRASRIEDFQRMDILRGLSSSVGPGAEHLLQAARAALVDLLQQSEQHVTTDMLTAISEMLNDNSVTANDPEPILELLAFVLDNMPIEHLAGEQFKWRTLLSRVQKSHFKSTIPNRLLAAIEVYRILGTIDVIRAEVLKKLQSMAKTNPLVRVRYTAAETLWCLTGDDRLKLPDFTRSGRENAAVLQETQLAGIAA